ncbi:hypothetical protein BLOT_011115 [Blomia tropicalis]|nr:hypothetical protein BLOT_011115 [Blomia tropicalis]
MFLYFDITHSHQIRSSISQTTERLVSPFFSKFQLAQSAKRNVNVRLNDEIDCNEENKTLSKTVYKKIIEAGKIVIGIELSTQLGCQKGRQY